MNCFLKIRVNNSYTVFVNPSVVVAFQQLKLATWAFNLYIWENNHTVQRKKFCSILFLFFFVSLHAQQTRQFTFKHFSSFNGLASNLVNNIIQDNEGYMWFATLDGLQRYDGNKFLSFRHQPGDQRSLSSDIINQLMIDRQKRLWVFCGDKVGIFDRSNFSFTPIQLEGDDPKQPFRIFFIDQDPNGDPITYVYQKGLFRYDEKRKIFRLFNDLGGLPGYLSHRHTPGSPYLFFADVTGIAIFDYRTGNLNSRDHNPDKNPLIEKIGNEKFVMDVYDMQGDLFWYATWDLKEAGAPHVKYINLKTGERNKFSVSENSTHNYTEIFGGMQQANGRMWFYGLTFILEWTGNKEKPFNYIKSEYKDEQSIKFDRVKQMYEDRQHNLWIATENGVFLFNPDAQLFSNYNLMRPDGSGSIDGPSASALQLKDGRVIIGSWASGLYMYDNNFNVMPLPEGLKKYQTPYAVWSIIQQKENGLVWMGLQGGSLIVFDPTSGKSQYIVPNEISQSTVRQITEDLHGNIWFGMQGGHVVKWNKKLSNGDPTKGYVVVRGRGPGFINKMFTDKDGFVWAATEGAGVFKFDTQTNKEIYHFTAEGNGQRLWSNSNNDIFQYNDSLLIIAGGALNVVNVKTNSVHFITTEEGLPSNTVYCLQRDKKGLFWLGMAHGLAQFNLEKGIATVYDRRDGLRYDNFMQAGVKQMNDGRLIFLSEHSFMAFDPSKALQTKPASPVITDFRLANRSIPVDSLKKLQRVSLRYDNTSIVIGFSNLNYVQQNKVHYFYKLDGVDNEWQESGPDNHVVYSHLPPGTFTFNVKAENADGVSGDEISALIIHVNPPFWRTWWFLGIIIFALIILIYWLDKFRMQKLRATESVRTRIATSLTEDLSNSLSSINISSELAKTKVDVDPQRTKEYINQISETSNRMMESVYDMVWSINPQNDTMHHTIDRMKIHAAEVENLFGIEVFFEIDNNVEDIDMNMEYRYELLSIYKEALDNAGRHSKAKHVHVNLRYMKSKLAMLIEDDGKGFDVDEAAVKRGLTDMRRRAAAINATFYIESEMNTGTIVKVVMPV